MRSGLLAAALLLALVAPADADILSQSQLLAIVRRSPQLHLETIGGRPYVGFKNGPSGAGYLDATILDYGQQRDTRDVLIVPLPSGGSGGVFTTLLFTNAKKNATYVGRIDSDGHLDVHLSAGVLTAVMPVYGPRDPQSSPSGHKIVRYRIAGKQLVKIDEFSGP